MTLSSESFDELLRTGVAALKAGDRSQAMSLLARAVRVNPRSEQAWLFLAGAVSDIAQRRNCLERVLSLNPQNEAALRGLRSLSPTPAPAATPVAPSPAPAPKPPPAVTPTPRPAPLPVAAPTPKPEPLPVAAPAPLPTRAPTPAPAPDTADHVMALLTAKPTPAAITPQPALVINPPPAMDTTTRLPPAFISLEVQPAIPIRRPPNRIVWALVLALGVILMLGSAAYVILLVRG